MTLSGHCRRPFATDEILIGSHENKAFSRIARTVSKKTFFFHGPAGVSMLAVESHAK